MGGGGHDRHPDHEQSELRPGGQPAQSGTHGNRGPVRRRSLLPLRRLSGKPGGQVAAISRYTEHIDVFTVGADGLVYSSWWDAAGGWAVWFQLGVT